MDVPSLEHLSVVKITTTLWNSVDIKGFRSEYYEDLHSAFPAMLDTVIKKVSKLLLPRSLQQKIINIVESIGNQIELWEDYYTKTGGLEIDLPQQKIFWTSEGTIDEIRTIQEFIKNPSVKITTRYKLACNFCLENDVRQLWNELPQSKKKLYYNEGAHIKIKKQKLITFWTYNVNGQLSKLNDLVGQITSQSSTVYQYGFEYAAITRNIIALKYFLGKLSPSERKISLRRAIERLVIRLIDLCPFLSSEHFSPKVYYSEIISFLFLNMDKEEQIIMMEGDSSQVLECFLDWPRQRSFMNIVRPMLPHILEEEYEDLLYAIIIRVELEWKDYDYLQLFGIFWQEGLTTVREVARGDVRDFLLSKFFEVEDSKCIRSLLREINLEEVKNYIFSDEAHRFIGECAVLGDWRPIEFIIQEFISRNITSEDELKTLRNTLKKEIKLVLLDDFNLQRRFESQKFLRTLDTLF